jgi:2,4-dienoyl-CoA reductase-like NADH-dependent reductase (Old Yellow Enzyme family)
MPELFDPLRLRDVTVPNRIAMSPMCTYSCEARDGVPGTWHLHHLASRAAGGAGLILTEATAVEPRGRISLEDTGLWDDSQVDAWRRVTGAIAAMGAVPGIQLAHAGRKAGTRRPWDGRGPVPEEQFHDPIRGPEDLWPVAPSSLPFDPRMRVPDALDAAGLRTVRDAWVAATRRAADAGFQVLEIHMAHGYLLHQFLTPLVNQRDDAYGGGLDGRLRFPLEVVHEVRRVWPEQLPIIVRISATDWVDGGWDLEQSVALAARLREAGIDLVDVSSGGAVPGAMIGPTGAPPEPGYQVPFAREIRERAAIATGAVGLITEPEQAAAIIADGDADLVLLGRALLRDPYWPHRAAERLGVSPRWPDPYAWAVS